MSLNEINDRRPENMKPRGFLQLSADLDSHNSAVTIVNVMSTDRALMSGLDDKVFPDHVVLSVNGIEYFINTVHDRSYTDGSLTTDANVYAVTASGYIAMRATTVVREGKALINADNPVSMEFKDGTVKTVSCYTSEKTHLIMQLDTKPKRVTLNGGKFGTWQYDKKNGLTCELPSGKSVLALY